MLTKVKYIIILVICMCLVFLYLNIQSKMQEKYDSGYKAGYNTCTIDYNKQLAEKEKENIESINNLTKKLNDIRSKYNAAKKNLTCTELFNLRVPDECVPSKQTAN